jgi:hypothetical protein
MAIHTILSGFVRCALLLGSTVLALPTVCAHVAPSAAGERSARSITGQTPPGGAVLYSQAILDYDGQHSSAFISTSYADPDVSAYSVEAADDFYVADASGWTIDQVTAQGLIYSNIGVEDVGAFKLTIYADDAGLPSATAACSYDALPNSPGLRLNGGWTAFGLMLPTPCRLQQGRYWLSIVATPPVPWGRDNTWAWNSIGMYARRGHPLVVRNPGGVYYPNCPTWNPIGNCSSQVEDNFVFQIIGSINAEAAPADSGISLAVGLAQYDGDPNQCGQATHLAASVGDQINACYTVTNRTPLTLNYQTLVDASGGVPLLRDANIAIAPGESYQYNRVFVAIGSESLDPMWTAQTVLPPYAPTISSDAFVDITATGTQLEIPYLMSGLEQPLPFAFPFYGQAYSRICIGELGLIAFVATPAGNCGVAVNNDPLPFTHGLAVGVGPALMPWWDDFGSAGKVHVATLGTAPTRQFVIEWSGMNHRDDFSDPGDPGRVTFEAILNEADGSFDYRYRTVEFDAQDGVNDFGRSGTIGFQAGQTGPSNYQYSWGAPALSDGLSLHWSPGESAAFTASQSATLDVGAPSLALDSTALTASAEAGSATTATIHIGNDGNRVLEWTSGEMRAGPQHYPIPPTSAALRTQRGATDGLFLRSGVVDAAQRPSETRAPAPQRYHPPVPAFGQALSPYMAYGAGNAYSNLDASFPGVLQSLGASPRVYVTGTFADYDFSTEYVVDGLGNLLAVSTLDGTERMIGNTGLSGETIGRVSGMSWDPVSGATHLVTLDFNACSGTSATLYVVDLSSAQTRPIGAMPGVKLIDIATDSAGTLWGVDMCSQNTVVVDKTNGDVRVVGPLGINVQSISGLAFDAGSGTLYLSAIDFDTYDPATDSYEAKMYTIDQQSGQATVVADGYGGFVGPVIPYSVVAGTQFTALAIATQPGPCATMNDIPWLGESPSEGSVQPGSVQAVTLTFDASELAPGIYTGNACFNSNDPDRRQVAVPVTFTVTGDPDIIFSDGFDS